MVTLAETLQSQAENVLMQNYGARNLALVRGQGAHVWDSEGRRYLDLLSGLGVNNLGHCHPKVVAAIQKQAQTLLHVSNLYLIEPQVQLAGLLVEHSPADRVFFCNSGTEAVEAAIKLARRYSYDHHGPGRHTIIALQNSFHGRTMGSLSATGQAKYQKGFEPMLERFVHVPINDLEALKAAVDETVCAVLLEPVQGEGGIHPCRPEYLRGVREVCDQHRLLLMFDEIQCGLGRSGHLFAADEFGVEPDVITLAKSLAGGVPIGAMLAKEEPAQSLVAGTHAATFGGNPLSCAAGVAAFQTIVDEKLPERSRALGGRFKERLLALQRKHEAIVEVRGLGLMLGVQLTFPAADALAFLRERGILAGTAGPEVLRFLPPLIVEEDELLASAEVLDEFLTTRR
ncbi:MAG TPA: acetylornithine transaminase [bacterium]|nr:acetylornithine transaminase [Candidatus Omnitrophota bacterium]HOJ59450.1 acetylornithine transaminase [bacterium]HOL94421.1 acetylornithine transaminase [bacterium]HPO99522.1 acetylornithine transaminase [bacterium]